MGRVKLFLSNPQITYRLTAESFGGWCLTWTVRSDGWRSVALASGGDLRNMEGILILSVGKMDAMPPEKGDEERLLMERPGHPVGVITHMPATALSSDGFLDAYPEAYEAKVLVSKAEMVSLVDRVQAGKGPLTVDLSVPRFKYGWAPDGSEQDWDNSQRPWEVIDDVVFVFTEPKREPEPSADPLPHDGSARSPEEMALARLTDDIARFGAYVTGALIAIILILIAIRWNMAS